MSKKDESIGEELFIEELGDVRGGMILVPGNVFTLARGKGEEGTVVQPPDGGLKRLPWPGNTKPPKMTTMMYGGGENPGVPPVLLPV